MQPSTWHEDLNALRVNVSDLMDQLPTLNHGTLIYQALQVLVNLTQQEHDRLDWKILLGSLQDMEQAFSAFQTYRHIRKVAVFGSARTIPSDPNYQVAMNFARCMTEHGFMIMTGAGPGIMQAANQGAGCHNSFGLHVQLPFESAANPFIDPDSKLLQFKYFFTRKLFFLREADAIAIFPGGFGTQDEAFECLTLMQMSKFGPVPMVLIDRPNGDYWQSWQRFIEQQLLGEALIGSADRNFYTIADRLETACNVIQAFYRVYHSSRYVGDHFVMRLNAELGDAEVERLNLNFRDILVDGKICKSVVLPQERGDGTESLPRLIFKFNRRNMGRLYQLIARVNQMGTILPELSHPEQT